MISVSRFYDPSVGIMNFPITDYVQTVSGLSKRIYLSQISLDYSEVITTFILKLKQHERNESAKEGQA